MKDPYGNTGETATSAEVKQGQIATRIWGHRLRIGQAWIEYLLEFLNVVAGYDYRLGQGCDGEKYRCFTRIGLRRFVFYDGAQAGHPDDAEALNRLVKTLSTKAKGDHEAILALAKQLLRSLTAFEKDRSWYAKSLFPVHENLLFFEALRPRATLGIASGLLVDQDEMSAKDAEDLDKPIEYTARNFFCRGGEVYYLCLSSAAERDRARGDRVMAGLKQLLQGQSREIGQLAHFIDSAWSAGQSGAQPTEKGFALGYITDDGAELYGLMLEDLDRLLLAKLDPLETLSLMAHLICFHIILYIYHHTERILQAGPPTLPPLLVDCSNGAATGLRYQSSAILRERDKLQEMAVRKYVRDQVDASIGRKSLASGITDDLTYTLLDDLGLSPSKRKRELIEDIVTREANQYERKKIKRDTLIERVSEAIAELFLADFRKNFKGIHRKLAQGIGFLLPRTVGSYPRYVLSDNLLRTLTIANFAPGQTFEELLKRLYGRYGLVVGYEQASAAKLVKRLRIDSDSYRINEAKLMERMKQTGLVIEYSDSTAVVRGIGHDV